MNKLMDYEALRIRVTTLRDVEIPQEENKYLVALVPHTFSTIEEITDGPDIIWMKVKGNITIADLKRGYTARTLPNEPSASLSPYLLLADQLLRDDVTIGTLDNYNDKLVVMQGSFSPLGQAISRESTPGIEFVEQTAFPVQGLHSVEQKFDETAPTCPSMLTPESTPFDARKLDLHVQARLEPAHDFSSAKATTSCLPSKICAEASDDTELTISRAQSEGALHHPANPFDISAIKRADTVPLHGDAMTQRKHLENNLEDMDGDQPVSEEMSLVETSEEKDVPADGIFVGQSKDPLPYDCNSELRSSASAGEVNMEIIPPKEFSRFNPACMQNMSESQDVKHLEALVKVGLKTVSGLESILQGQPLSGDIACWMTQIELLKKQVQNKPTIIGIVGSTGAGKSSLINSLLGEESLVPTSCMEACTAAPTEIRWNDRKKTKHKYRAEIEFITKSEWKKELDLLFEEMLDRKGKLSSQTSNSESDAGRAYLKIKAVYPNWSKEQLAQSSVDVLLREPHVKEILGQTTSIAAHDAKEFYQQLKRYVETNASNGECLIAEQGSKQPEWWPLITCARIYLKADVLSTGVVLVDLPGIQDSNAARGAVARDYMMRCTHIFVVAPITRAVSDKAAKELFGSHFKRQMKFDGMISNVTFICSKTDDISVEEAVRSLGIDAKISQLKAKQSKAIENGKSAEKRLKEMNSILRMAQSAKSQALSDEKEWTALKQKIASGLPAFAPEPKPTNKRKQNLTSTGGRSKTNKRKKSGIFHLDFDTEFEDADNEVADTSPLTERDIEAKLTIIQGAHERSLEKIEELKSTRKSLKQEMKISRELQDKLQDDQKALCIAMRNKWSKTRIQHDYALGIQEMDQDREQEANEDEFDPDVDVRDYDEVASSLPVFCVSSRAFQSLSNQSQSEEATKGFTALEETELPQLKTHCMKMTEASRITSSKVFLENLTRLLVSISLWSCRDESSAALTEEEQELERSKLIKRLAELEDTMGTALDLILMEINTTQNVRIQKLCRGAVTIAARDAVPIAVGWAGLPYMTYKAAMRRDGGPYESTTKGKLDFNKALSEPFERHIVSGWEMCFQQELPKVLKTFSRRMGASIQKFHEAVSRPSQDLGIIVPGLGLMAQKLDLWKQDLNHFAEELNSKISTKQKEASRDLTGTVKDDMLAAYQQNAAESGQGQFKTMKRHMENYVKQQAPKMFKRCTKVLNDHMQKIRTSIEEQTKERHRTLLDEIRQDYMNIINGLESGDEELTDAQRKMHINICEIVEEAEDTFFNITSSFGRSGEVKMET